MNTTETTKPEKVGVLLVHGIGEQCQFEHLEGEARNIATSLRKLAAKTNERNVATALWELAAKTGDKHLKEALEAAKKINEENLVTLLPELVAKIKEGDLATALQELVDKIPELTKFEFAELAAKKLAGKARTVQVVVNSFPSAAFGAKQETWHDGGRAPVMVEVYDYNYEDEKVFRINQIYFHQVWWADLDEPTTLWSEIRFWLWGLSLWTIDGKFQTGIPGYDERMKPPKNVQDQTTIGGWTRLRLFWVSLVILLILPFLSLLNFVLRRLLAFKIPPPDIFAQFIGDVKLFQQEKQIGKGPLQDIGLPPRVTLRRRMIRGLVEMALRRYDRWYILAHSQGTVLAFNGIMETAQSLPNYLTKDLWKRCIVKSLIREAQDDEKLTAKEKKRMQPPFPSWRDKEYILDRRKLFENLRGLLTYGSPLSKFATLWPVIVPLNKDSCVFYKDSEDPQKNFQWLNIYDPTDPVAGGTQPFRNQKSPSGSTYNAPEPIDIPYKANLFHLLSHVQYLTFSKGKDPRLVDIVANWLVEGDLTINKDNLTVSTNELNVKRGNPGWPKLNLLKFYQVLRVATWVFAAFLVGSLLSVLISAVPQLSSYFQPITSLVLNLMSPWLQLSVMPLGLKLIVTAFLGCISYILLAAIVVLITGILVKLFVRNLGKL